MGRNQAHADALGGVAQQATQLAQRRRRDDHLLLRHNRRRQGDLLQRHDEHFVPGQELAVALARPFDKLRA